MTSRKVLLTGFAIILAILSLLTVIPEFAIAANPYRCSYTSSCGDSGAFCYTNDYSGGDFWSDSGCFIDYTCSYCSYGCRDATVSCYPSCTGGSTQTADCKTLANCGGSQTGTCNVAGTGWTWASCAGGDSCTGCESCITGGDGVSQCTEPPGGCLACSPGSTYSLTCNTAANCGGSKTFTCNALGSGYTEGSCIGGDSCGTCKYCSESGGGYDCVTTPSCCGNGIREGSEESEGCDWGSIAAPAVGGGNGGAWQPNGVKTCWDGSSVNKRQRCSTGCQFEYEEDSCLLGCGDGITTSPDEACDGASGLPAPQVCYTDTSCLGISTPSCTGSCTETWSSCGGGYNCAALGKACAQVDTDPGPGETLVWGCYACTPGATQSQTCRTTDCKDGTQTRTCSGSSTWGNYGACTAAAGAASTCSGDTPICAGSGNCVGCLENKDCPDPPYTDGLTIDYYCDKAIRTCRQSLTPLGSLVFYCDDSYDLFTDPSTGDYTRAYCRTIRGQGYEGGVCTPGHGNPGPSGYVPLGSNGEVTGPNGYGCSDSQSWPIDYWAINKLYPTQETKARMAVDKHYNLRIIAEDQTGDLSAPGAGVWVTIQNLGGATLYGGTESFKLSIPTKGTCAEPPQKLSEGAYKCFYNEFIDSGCTLYKTEGYACKTALPSPSCVNKQAWSPGDCILCPATNKCADGECIPPGYAPNVTGKPNYASCDEDNECFTNYCTKGCTCTSWWLDTRPGMSGTKCTSLQCVTPWTVKPQASWQPGVQIYAYAFDGVGYS